MKRLSEAYMQGILSTSDEDDFKALLDAADKCRKEYLDNSVYLRGLIEISNHCNCNCLYCGIRKNNKDISRYSLKQEEIIELAMTAYHDGYQSICLQSGEVNDDKAINFLADVVKKIKELSSRNDSQGLGITLSVGELSYRQYQKLWQAGAHRYLLRIETSDDDLFRSIHPPSQSFAKRLECLDALKDIGYQVGTGIMIGLPGQNAEHLLRDLVFFRERNIDMLGMGPYIPHPAAPLSRITSQTFLLDAFTSSIKMIALSRLSMPDINIVASTALQSIHPDGLKMGLQAGANIVMPVMTPPGHRQNYNLYENKIYTHPQKLLAEILSCGYEVSYWKWGDPVHYYKRQGLAYPHN